MSLPLALVFRFSQPTSENIEIANRTAYRGLLNVLRAHPQLKFNLHLSGTLLHGLAWFDPETLALVKAGVADGQFELLGGAYAATVLCAADDWDNAQQLALHTGLLQRHFGVAPRALWLSGRGWRQSLLPVIAAAGFTTTLIEDQRLHAAGLVDPVPASTAEDAHSLTLVYDDTILRDRLNYAAWFGRRAQLFKYLQQVAERPGSDRFLLAYAEEAEALGLWGWEQGYLPQAAWAQLDALLAELESAGTYTLHHLSEACPVQTLPALPEGAAAWMDRAVQDPDAPGHEAGYNDWGDFNRRAPRLTYFRRLHQVLRLRLQALARRDPGSGRPPAAAREVFFHQAVEAYCHHQYGFGRPGVGARGEWGWENVRAAVMLARAAELADNPAPGQWIEDANADAAEEVVACNGKEVVVFTPCGGRVLYWFDLKAGAQWAGNQLAVPLARYEVGEGKVPTLTPRPARWLPESYEPSLKSWAGARQKEPAPTALGRRLPAWLFEKEADELMTYRCPGPESEPARPLAAQTGLFADALSVDGGPPGAVDEVLDFRFEPEGVTFLLFPAPDLYVEKHLAQTAGGLRARYVFDNRDEVARRLRLVSSYELNPDYAALLGQGRDALAYYLHDDRWPAVKNTRTGLSLVLEPSLPWTDAVCAPMLLALEVRLTFEIEVAPRSQAALEIKLGRSRAARPRRARASKTG